MLALLLLVTSAEARKKKKALDPEDLFNPLLGVEYSHWLVGPIAEMASGEEIEAYLTLANDEAAEEFVEGFWAERATGNAFFGSTPRQVYEERAEEAENRFREGASPGSRSDRGKIFILYGEPQSIEFRTPQSVDVPILEVFVYAKDAEPGLDGQKPKREFRFFKDGDRTVLYTGKKLRRDPLAKNRGRFRN